MSRQGPNKLLAYSAARQDNTVNCRLPSRRGTGRCPIAQPRSRVRGHGATANWPVSKINHPENRAGNCGLVRVRRPDATRQSYPYSCMRSRAGRACQAPRLTPTPTVHRRPAPGGRRIAHGCLRTGHGQGRPDPCRLAACPRLSSPAQDANSRRDRRDRPELTRLLRHRSVPASCRSCCLCGFWVPVAVREPSRVSFLSIGLRPSGMYDNGNAEITRLGQWKRRGAWEKSKAREAARRIGHWTCRSTRIP
ncbi:hypothetical protein BS78_06G186600 [Paspalum vaginatum]|nr:hypothetical protein BS78_06G186600 [Paspalum vaginatum]